MYLIFFHTEVTALRAKIGEMRESSMSMEQDCRERVKEEYRDLIKNLLEASGVVKNKLDEFRWRVRGNLNTMSGYDNYVWYLSS